MDDGKSTLIGRLLHDCGALKRDQIEAARALSRARGVELDHSLLLDGLSAEREQGITIDVAYRYFSTPRRRFVVVDAPGHEQYTRNMATGASGVDLAVILADARQGLLTQTRRHAALAHLMGVRRFILAVNKMDLVDWSERAFREVADAFGRFVADLGPCEVEAVPTSAVGGDNVVRRSGAAAWWSGPTLLDLLETVRIAEPALEAAPFRMPVQRVTRPGPDFRGLSGTIRQGRVRPGDELVFSPSGGRARVARIVTFDGDLASAGPGEAVTLTLDREIDAGRGETAAAADAPPETADQFEADLVWTSEEPLLPGRSYLLKCAARSALATVTQIKHRVDVDDLETRPARQLELNDVGRATLSLDRPLAFEPFSANPDLGGFILIDRLTRATLGCGMIRFALRRSHNIRWQPLEVDRERRAALLRQSPRVVWFTGLSGAGKSTIADRLERRLHALGRATYILDGDNLRHGLNRDLGFTERDRVENVRRAAEVAKLMADAGLIVLCCFISPYRAERRLAREIMPPGDFIEVFVDTPLQEAERRDVKGLYRKARAGELKNFTGVDAPYEPPEAAEVVIDTTRTDPDAAAEALLERLLILEAEEARNG